MRRWAVVLSAMTLLVGCSHTVGGQAQPSKFTPPSSSSAPSITTSSTSAPPVPAPADGSPIGDVIAWVTAGTPATDPGFHSATRDGTTTSLGDDMAFTTPAGSTRCMTDSSTGALACIVRLKEPPPRPPDIEGEWVGGWVDYQGAALNVGSVHGDPGPFVTGDGPLLPYGQTLKFLDYQCRSDQAWLYCVNTAAQSGVRMSDAGVEPLGCLKPAPAPPDVWRVFSC
jgi:hypothetical protein